MGFGLDEALQFLVAVAAVASAIYAGESSRTAKKALKRKNEELQEQNNLIRQQITINTKLSAPIFIKNGFSDSGKTRKLHIRNIGGDCELKTAIVWTFPETPRRDQGAHNIAFNKFNSQLKLHYSNSSRNLILHGDLLFIETLNTGETVEYRFELSSLNTAIKYHLHVISRSKDYEIIGIKTVKN